jgi:hypothetical protein
MLHFAFLNPPFQNLVCSSLGLIPKNIPGKFRLIHDLSFPKGNSNYCHILQVHIQVREVLVELAYVLAVFVPVALLTVLVQSSWGCGSLQNLHACLYGQGLVAHLRCRLKAKHNFWPRKRFD